MLDFIWQAVVVFIVSTTLFDGVHYLLHSWKMSRFALLRTFASWHQVHHDFLDKQMQVHPELVARNLWAHLIPEFLTSIGGTLAMAVIFPIWPVLAVAALHLVLFVIRVKEEGMDINHMAMDRLDGRRGVFAVNPSFHAMHHINPRSYYSSFLSVFDMIFGTALAIRGKRVLLTGANGALGAAMMERLTKMGALVTPLRYRIEMGSVPDELLAQFDILAMCHGAKDSPFNTWGANYWSPAHLGEQFIHAGKDRLVPPEIWLVGSEAEFVGKDSYARSKRMMADYAATFWFSNPNVTYRHIVPSAFTSKLNGLALMSPGFVADVALFLIRRGFRYIPVTYTGLAFLNWFRFQMKAFRWHSKQRTAHARQSG